MIITLRGSMEDMDCLAKALQQQRNRCLARADEHRTEHDARMFRDEANRTEKLYHQVIAETLKNNA